MSPITTPPPQRPAELTLEGLALRAATAARPILDATPQAACMRIDVSRSGRALVTLSPTCVGELARLGAQLQPWRISIGEERADVVTDLVLDVDGITLSAPITMESARALGLAERRSA